MAPLNDSGGEQTEEVEIVGDERSKRLTKTLSEIDGSTSESEEEEPTTSREDAKRKGKIMVIVNKNIPLFYGKQGPHLAADVTVFLIAVDHVGSIARK